MSRSRSPIAHALLLFLIAARPALSFEGGYASQTSVVRGGSIDLHISTAAPAYSISIFREGAQRVLMKRITGLKGRERDCDEPAYRTGCGWPVSYTLDVPASWPSGVYLGQFNIGPTGTSPTLSRSLRRTTSASVDSASAGPAPPRGERSSRSAARPTTSTSPPTLGASTRGPGNSRTPASG